MLCAINSIEALCLVVVLKQRLGLFFVSIEPNLDLLRRIVGPMSQLYSFVPVTQLVSQGRFKIEIIDLTAFRAIAPSSSPPLKHLERDLNNNRDNLVALSGCQILEHRGLRHRARKPIQHIAVSAIVPAGPFLDNSDYQIIRDIAACGLGRPYLFTQCRLGLGQRPKQIAGGDLGKT